MGHTRSARDGLGRRQAEWWRGVDPHLHPCLRHPALTCWHAHVPACVGGGATEIELALQLAEWGKKHTGLEQYAISKFAEAFEVCKWGGRGCTATQGVYQELGSQGALCSRPGASPLLQYLSLGCGHCLNPLHTITFPMLCSRNTLPSPIMCGPIVLPPPSPLRRWCHAHSVRTQGSTRMTLSVHFIQRTHRARHRCACPPRLLNWSSLSVRCAVTF